MANKFTKGQKVVMKSGGPPMTVSKEPGEPARDYPFKPLKDYDCEWFKGATPMTGEFAEHVLEPYIPPSR